MDQTRKKIRFRKMGGGSLRYNGKIIKPREVFEAYPDEIPSVFMDVIVPLDELKDEPFKPKVEQTEYKVEKVAETEARKEPKTEEETVEAEVEETEVETEAEVPEVEETVEAESKMESAGGGWFNIINVKTGKRINEKSLRRSDALQFIKELEGK